MCNDFQVNYWMAELFSNSIWIALHMLQMANDVAQWILIETTRFASYNHDICCSVKPLFSESIRTTPWIFEVLPEQKKSHIHHGWTSFCSVDSETFSSKMQIFVLFTFG